MKKIIYIFIACLLLVGLTKVVLAEEYDVTIKAGESTEIDLPDGAYYEIEEVETTGWELDNVNGSKDNKQTGILTEDTTYTYVNKFKSPATKDNLKTYLTILFVSIIIFSLGIFEIMRKNT